MNTKISNPSIPKKFYFLSLLCLIPAFGVLIGIVLICYAIFEFKSVKLFFVILSAISIGIVILILDRAFLKHDLEYGEETGAHLAVFSADGLDNLVKKLEIYKLEEGQYPDSLKQLQRLFPGVMIMDPLLGRNPGAHKSINYYYKRNGEEYILFSSGIDGIPNTNDDIYPRKPLKTPVLKNE